MAAYYHPHHHHGTNTEIQDHNSNNNNNNNNFHTLILMNPNLADAQHHHHNHHHHHPQPPQPPPSHNILLLNSAATLSPPPPPPLQQPFLSNPHHFARPPNNVTLYGYPSHEARDIPRARQGLSLTLSSQNPALGGGPHHGGDADVAAGGGGGGGGGGVLGSKYLKAAQELLEEVVDVRDDGVGFFKSSSNTTTPTNTTNNNNNNSDNNLNSPKKANNNINNTNNNNTKGVGDSPSEDRAKHGGDSGGGGGGSGGGGGGGGGGGQLSTAERQEIQMKKAKLVTMLDEAEQRYRHYNHQMQLVIESFEQAAGMGSAKTYTALALKTISKQFRCLKDAIHGQIKAANKMLGDDHEGGGSGSSAGGKIEGSRLKYIDHQIRQQRALQQLGMIQNPNAWRPQRGLPERSVSVLRAWLFEHFLHPYPKDSDKIMLAKQTGLTRSQVSNWFINARVRLWKPMIEEMYTEELKEQEQNNGLSEEKLANSSKENSHNEDNAGSFNPINNQESINIAENNLVKSCKDQNNNANAVAANTSSFIGNNSLTQNQHGFTLSSSFEMEGGISQRSPKRQRNEEMFPSYNNGSTNPGEILIKFGNEKHERENTDGNGNGNGYPIISGGMNFLGGGELAGAYPIAEMGRFETEDFSAPPRFLHGNGISLSLGLPPSENHHQQLDNLSATNHTFMSPNPSIQFRRTNEFGSMNSPSSHSSAAAFECIDIQNRKGFATQLLPDFVT